MDVIGQYHSAVTAMLQKIADTQRETIGKAAGRLADAIAQDRYIYVIGTGGHSYIAADSHTLAEAFFVSVLLGHRCLFSTYASFSERATRS